MENRGLIICKKKQILEIQNEAQKYSKNHVLFEKEIVIFKDDCLINFKLWMQGFTMYVTCSCYIKAL